jgi:hypothetical protein
VIGLVAKQELPILESDPSDPQTMPERVLQIVHPYVEKPARAGPIQLRGVALRGAPTRSLQPELYIRVTGRPRRVNTRSLWLPLLSDLVKNWNVSIDAISINARLCICFERAWEPPGVRCKGR